MVRDKNGIEVTVGSKVRVLDFDSHILDRLPDDEGALLKSMINEVLEVYDVDQFGRAWVEKWWNYDDGRSESQSLGLSSKEMLVVETDT